MLNSNEAIEVALRALANDRRLMILEWLKHPKTHFRRQADGDLVIDGVCGVLIAEKLGVKPADRKRASQDPDAGRIGHAQAGEAMDVLQA